MERKDIVKIAVKKEVECMLERAKVKFVFLTPLHEEVSTKREGAKLYGFCIIHHGKDRNTYTDA